VVVERAAVVGAGTMGAEIAQVIAGAGIDVILRDVRADLVERGLDRARSITERRLRKHVERGRLTSEDAERQLAEASGRLSGTTDYDGFAGAEVVIEAVPERMELKHAVMAELDAVTNDRAILASNTSALSISAIGAVTRRPERVVGLHFFYPASVMRLVEVVVGANTAPETARRALNFASALGKQPVRCGERAGFVVNRILVSALAEAFRAREEAGLAPEDVDSALRDGGGLPMGPFQLYDQLGLDTMLAIEEHLREHHGERFHVSDELRSRVAAGELGRKTGRGFYEHRS